MRFLELYAKCSAVNISMKMSSLSLSIPVLLSAAAPTARNCRNAEKLYFATHSLIEMKYSNSCRIKYGYITDNKRIRFDDLLTLAAKCGFYKMCVCVCENENAWHDAYPSCSYFPS